MSCLLFLNLNWISLFALFIFPGRFCRDLELHLCNKSANCLCVV
uniref:Uncharacterized protein n=1 Tax=Rhizophora mucronata TaxID=61149 RepID=A0A2P2QES1_RHIMU